MNQQPRQRSPLFFLLAMALLISLVAGVFSMRQNTVTVQYSEVLELFRDEQVRAFTLQGNALKLELYAENDTTKTVTTTVGDTAVFHADLDELIAEQYARGILKSYNYPQAAGTPWYKAVLPYVLGGIVLLFVLFLLISRTNGGASGMAQFTRANAHFGVPGKEKVTFEDVAGADEEKAELQQIVDFLRDPKRFYDMGAHVPKGVLLVGPPGTGKTLLARAVAGEADVSFLSISGSDFVELYVGVGASRVRDLFEQAKRVSPCIVFIDEIDAVGRRRGAGLGGGHDEREQTLNQLLVEMDGFGKNEGVIVLAATNRKDILDPALLRPGRFDRQIYVGTPDWRGREAILKVHAKDKPLAEDVELSSIAKATAGFTGADLSNLMNEAALLATERNRRTVTMKDMEDAMIKLIAGPEKRSRVVPQHERRLTAFHEAGHAVAMHHLSTQEPVHQITIIPRGTAGGMTISLPTDDTSYLSRNEMFETIVSLLGGRVAEQLKLDDISTGASNDLQRATGLARDMVSRYGMSERLGPVCYASDDEVFIGRNYEKTKAYSERIAGDIDEEIHQILQRAYDRCTELLREHDAQLERIAQFLLQHGTMTRVQFEAAMAGKEVLQSTPEAEKFHVAPNEQTSDEL